MSYDNPPANPYGQQDPYGQQQPAPGKGLAIAALVCGILALLLSITVVGGIALGLIAIGLGIAVIVKAGKGTAGGRVMGIIGLVLGVLGLLISGAVIVAATLFVNSDTAQNLRDCLNDAGDDQAAIEQCQQDFADDLSGS